MKRQAVLAGVMAVAAIVLAAGTVGAEQPDEAPSETVQQEERGPLEIDAESAAEMTQRKAIERGVEVYETARGEDRRSRQRMQTITEQLATDLAAGVRREVRTDYRRLPLMLTGNIAGNFARVNCRKEEGYQELYWARHVAYHQALQQRAAYTDLAAPIALNVGNSLFPGAVGRYLAAHRQPGLKQLSELIGDLPLAVHGVANREFALPRPALIDFVEAMADQDVELQAANLTCEDFEGAEAICANIVSSGDEKRFRVEERDGVSVAVTTVLDPQLFHNLSRFQYQGVDIGDPEEVLPELVDQMQQEADVVVVQHQVPPSVASQRAYDLASTVKGIDLLVASHMIDSPAQAGQFDPEQPVAGGRMPVIEAASTGTPIVSANSGEHGVVNVELEISARDGSDDPQWRVDRAIPRRIQLGDGPYHQPTKERLESIIGDFCEDWGDPIGDDAELVDDFEMEDLQQFVLNVMRFATRSEVALVNRGSFRNQKQFPLTGELTKADIYTSLPFGNRLVTVEMKGSVLEGLAGRIGDDVLGAGVEVDGSTVKVNGRSVSSERIYQVAINDFLSEGGDGVFAAGDFDNAAYHHPGFTDDPPTIGEVVIDYVQRGEHLRRGKQREQVDATENFPDLHQRFLWSFASSLNASYNQVSVQNPEGAYEEGPLTVQAADQINLEGRWTADADARFHGWNNRLDIQYATSRVADDGDATFQKTRDRIRLRSRYRYKRLRAMQDGVWYVPDPFVEGQTESEFQRPEDRDWHRLNLRGITGASFQLFDPLELQLGVNVSHEVLEPESAPTWGVNAAYTLARVSPVRLFDRPVRVQSEVEYFFNDIARQNIHELRSSNRLYFAVFEQFFFTTTFNAFAYRDDVVGEWGTNTELTIGVNYEWERALQRF